MSIASPPNLNEELAAARQAEKEPDAPTWQVRACVAEAAVLEALGHLAAKELKDPNARDALSILRRAAGGCEAAAETESEEAMSVREENHEILRVALEQIVYLEECAAADNGGIPDYQFEAAGRALWREWQRIIKDTKVCEMVVGAPEAYEAAHEEQEPERWDGQG